MMKSSHAPPRGQPKRWLALLLASVLLHLLILNKAGWQMGIPAPAPHPPQNNVVTAQLHLRQMTVLATTLTPTLTPATPVPRPSRATRKPAAKSKPKPTPKPADTIPGAPAMREVVPPETAPDETTTSADPMAGMEVPGSSIEPAIVLAPDDAPAARTEPIVESESESDAELANASALQQAIAPPPVLLKYEVESKKNGKAVYGSGKITWQTDGNAYAVNGEASVLFFTVLEFRSEGAIDSFGMAPRLYSEKRFRKSATNTHFQREPKVVSFSASTLTYPRQGGEQDRASIIWQLASVGRGDSRLFVPDAQIEVMVAGVRDAEIWQIRVIGLELITIPAGQMPAWHLVRQPRADSHDQKIDIWLAPERDWYPVRLRFTENNGDYLDMAASVIEQTAPLSTNPQEQ